MSEPVQVIETVPMLYKNRDWKHELLAPARCQTPFRPNETIFFPPCITLTPNGVLELEATYAWNGPSVPLLKFKWILKLMLWASAFHDALYQLMAAGLLARTEFNREKADALFRDHVRDRGANAIVCGMIYFALRTFGAKYTDPERFRTDNKTLEAF